MSHLDAFREASRKAKRGDDIYALAFEIKYNRKPSKEERYRFKIACYGEQYGQLKSS